jgi:hypothetical protein
MKPLDTSPVDRQDGTLNRRTMITGSVATGVAALGQQVAAQSDPGTPNATSQATPAASPASVDIDAGKLMMLSANLCGGAILNADHVDGLVALLGSEENIKEPLDELFAVEWFTEESLAETSREAQQVAGNILQYWFVGWYNGEPVKNRTGLYFDLAGWQALPYRTEQSACKELFYWAEEIDLESGQ